MAFPDTRQTMIQRIATTGNSEDWRQLLEDYWGPVCRFATGRAGLKEADAEDVAAETFEALLANRLLGRWLSNRSAKLRTLLCSVVRNILSNRVRVEQGRARLLRQQADQGAGRPESEAIDISDVQVDAFYAAWAADQLGEAVQTLLHEYHAEGKGDYFRVLHGRVCEDLSMPQIADALGIRLTSAENYFRAARKRLTDVLQERTRSHVARYCPVAEQDEEWRSEWMRLGDYLTTHGGLEKAVREACDSPMGTDWRRRKPAQITTTLSRIFAQPPESSGNSATSG